MANYCILVFNKKPGQFQVLREIDLIKLFFFFYLRITSFVTSKALSVCTLTK